ncbi:MAG: SGNH/GDSL hydrolase family protein [Gemmatimonadales bacterium]
MRLHALRLILLLAAASCGSTSPDQTPDPDLRILFIGNSLTYANNLPSLVQHLGESNSARPVVVSSVAFGGYSLEDHWNQGAALAAIKQGGWDLVVMQQGPSALPESRTNLIEWTGRFAAEIRKVGARPAVYMVWPPLDSQSDWDAVTASYAAAATAANAVLFPAGEALRSAYQANPGMPLFDTDGFHPARLGSEGVALVIYAVAANVSPVGLTERAGGSTFPASHIATLESAAADAIARYDH